MRSCSHADKECRSCFKERIGSVGVASSATPTRRPASGGKRPSDKGIYNSWERGIAKDERNMPYLDNNGAALGVKKFAESRSEYRKTRKTTRDLNNG